MKSLSRFIVSAIILAQSVFKDVTATSNKASNLPPSAGLQLGAATSQGVSVFVVCISLYYIHMFMYAHLQEISGVIYYNNCNFTSKLLGTISYPEEASTDTIPLTSNLPANYSEWVKFDSLQVSNNTVVRVQISYDVDCASLVVDSGSFICYISLWPQRIRSILIHNQ